MDYNNPPESETGMPPNEAQIAEDLGEQAIAAAKAKLDADKLHEDVSSAAVIANAEIRDKAKERRGVRSGSDKLWGGYYAFDETQRAPKRQVTSTEFRAETPPDTSVSTGSEKNDDLRKHMSLRYTSTAEATTTDRKGLGVLAIPDFEKTNAKRKSTLETIDTRPKDVFSDRGAPDRIPYGDDQVMVESFRGSRRNVKRKIKIGQDSGGETVIKVTQVSSAIGGGKVKKNSWEHRPSDPTSKEAAVARRITDVMLRRVKPRLAGEEIHNVQDNGVDYGAALPLPKKVTQAKPKEIGVKDGS